MGLFDKLRERVGSLTGDGSRGGTAAPTPGRAEPQYGASQRDPDEVAVERYRYMLRTAPPETVEQAHAEAFAKLTPEQRRMVLDDLNATVPESERGSSDDPQSLARMATRAEVREPGTMERALSRGRGTGGGMGMGGMIAGSLLAGVAGAFIGTAIADAFLGDELGSDMMAGGEEMAGDLGVPGIDDGGGMGDFDI
ncbi:MAG: hypothetical protein ACRDRV_07910 [Pseudonocardiaceae bacterium]